MDKHSLFSRWIHLQFTLFLMNCHLQGVAGSCISSCSAVNDGNYQACGTCTSYVSCGGGRLYNQPCGPTLYWDDNKKNCVTSSNTCSVGQTGVAGSCISSCSAVNDGNYQACGTCTSYVSCGGGRLYNQPCGPTLYWDDNKKNCVTSSNTCSVGQTDLLGFWPLNCRYYTGDVSNNGLSATYDPNIASMPTIQCGGQTAPLTGSLSFQIGAGTVITPKFLELNQRLPSTAQQASGFTWIAYMMVPSAAYTDSDTPIFSIGRNPAWRQSSAQVGLGIYWSSGNIQVIAASDDQITQFRMTIGTTNIFQRDTWVKLLATYDLSSSQPLVTLRIAKLASLSQYYQLPSSTAPRGFVPYTGGAIRFGLLDPKHNGNNTKSFRGEISCVQLYKTAFSSAQISSTWLNVPNECQQLGGSTTSTASTTSRTTTVSTTTLSPAEYCASMRPCNNDLSSQPGYTNGQCVTTRSSYYCLCPQGYRWSRDQSVCVDVDESLVQNCGCEGACSNKYVDRDGLKYQCACTGSQLGPDGHRCIAINSNAPTLKVWPLYGPKSGGTVIYIEDTTLDGTVTVTLDRTTLSVKKRSSNHYECTTKSLTDLSKLNTPQTLVINHNGVSHADLSFTYMEDPVITRVQPLRAIAAGGTILSVSGQHMDSVANPILIVKKDTQKYTAYCKPVSATLMECPTPTIDYLTVHSISGRRKRQSERELKEVYLGFDMDGVDMYKNMSKSVPDFSKVTVVMNPEFEPFPGDRVRDYNGQDRLDIKGSYMDMGATMPDYSVKVEHTLCTGMDLTSNVLSCQPPNQPPPIMRTDSMKPGLHKVMIHVGYYDFSVGYLNYKSDASLIPIVAGCVGGGVVLLIVVICIVCCIRKNGSNKKKEMYEKHHDFTYRQGKGLSGTKHTDDGKQRKHAKSNPYTGDKSVYSNAGGYENDFNMKKGIPDKGYEPLSKDKQDKKNSYSNLNQKKQNDYTNAGLDYEIVHEKSPTKDNNKNNAPKRDYMNMQTASSNNPPPGSAVSSGGGKRKQTVLGTSVPVHAGSVQSSYDYADASRSVNPIDRAQQVFGDFRKPPPPPRR